MRWLLLALLSLLALYSVGGRLALLLLPAQQQAMLDQLNGHYALEVSVDQIEAAIYRFDPLIRLRGLRLGGVETPWLHVKQLDLQLDFWNSLINLAPVLERLEIDGVRLSLSRGAEGHWELPERLVSELSLSNNGPVQLPTGGASQTAGWLESLFRQRSVSLSSVVLSDNNYPDVPVLQGDLEWRHRHRQQLLDVAFRDEEGELLRLQGRGQGVPGRSQFRFDYHLLPSTWSSSRLAKLALQLPVDAASVKAELWGAIRGTTHQQQTEISQLHLRVAGSGIDVQDMSARLLLSQQGREWLLAATDVRGQLQGNAWPVGEFLLSGTGGKVERLQAPQFDLAPLWRLFLTASVPALPAGLQERLAPLDPRGQLRNVSLSWASPGSWDSFTLVADLDRVGVSAWQGVPALVGVDGRLEVNADGGRVDLNSRQFDLDFPFLYQQGWRFSHAEGVVEWRLHPETVEVESELLSLSSDQVAANGRFRVEIPRFDYLQRGGRLVLMIGMENGEVESAPLFVPDRIVDPALFGWLKGALKRGRLVAGGLVYDAPLLNALTTVPQHSLQMFFDARGAEVNYQPGWPAITDADAFTLIKEGEVLVQTRRGRVYDETRVAQAEVALAAKTHTLQVKARLDGPAADGRLALLESPVGASLGEEFARWQVGGELHTELDLSINLDQPDDSQIRVDTHVRNGSYWSEILGLKIVDINGAVHFQSDYGLWSAPMSGKLFDRPLDVVIRTEQTAAGRVTRLRGQGGVALTDVRQWTGLPLFDAFTGETDYGFELSLCGEAPGCSTLRLDSRLLGVAVNAPAPFAKLPGYAAPLSLQLGLTPGTQWLRIAYPQIEGLFALQAGDLQGGALALGQVALPDRAPRDGVVVDARLEALDAQAWRVFIERYLLVNTQMSAEPVTAEQPMLRQVRLQTERLAYGDWWLDALQAQLTYRDDHWQVEVVSDSLDGSLVWPASSAEPVVVQLKQLRLPTLPEQSPGEARPQVEGQAAFDPATLPALDLTIDSLHRGEQQVGNLGLRLRPLADGVAIERLTGNLYGLATEAHGSWVRDAGGDTTSLLFKTKTNDFGRVMSRLGSARTLETARANLNGDLSWRGPLNRVDWPTLQGELDFAAKEGRLLDTGDQPVLKLFSLFNANTLLRRLKLDFSDLAKSGTSFDKLDAQLRIDQGVARTDGPAKLRGPQMDIDMDGAVDLANETLDIEMLAQLPISANLPIAAAVIATPAVAGAVFLIERLIGKQLKRFTSVRYRLQGPWANPKMEPVGAKQDAPSEPYQAGDR